MESRHAARLAALLTPAVILPALSMDIYVPAVPSMKTLMQTSESLIQWTLSIFMIGMAIGQLTLGPFADRFGRRAVALPSLFVFVLATWMCANAHSANVLILARLLQGLSACGAMLVSWAILRDRIEDGELRAKYYSYLSGVTGFAPILAPIIGGFLLVFYDSWRSIFWFLLIFGLILFALFFFRIPESLPKHCQTPIDRSILRRYSVLLSHREFLSFSIASAVGMSALFSYFSVSPILLIDKLSVAPDDFGYYFAISGTVYLICCFLSPLLQHRYGNSATVTIGAATMWFGATSMMIYYEFFGLSVLGIVIPNMFIYAGVGILFGPCVAGAMRHFGHMAGTASAMLGFIQFFIAALVGATITGDGVQNVMPYASAIAMLSTIAGLLSWFTTSRYLSHPQDDH